MLPGLPGTMPGQEEGGRIMAVMITTLKVKVGIFLYFMNKGVLKFIMFDHDQDLSDIRNLAEQLVAIDRGFLR